jgi:hypothetical protein
MNPLELSSASLRNGNDGMMECRVWEIGEMGYWGIDKY